MNTTRHITHIFCEFLLSIGNSVVPLSVVVVVAVLSLIGAAGLAKIQKKTHYISYGT